MVHLSVHLTATVREMSFEGGLGLTWPYVGGWELNARALVGLEQPMPDTLSVNFHEQGDLARVINRFLGEDDFNCYYLYSTIYCFNC